MQGFDHVTIAVSDLEQASAAYQRLLGRAPTWRGEQPDLGTHAALFGLENALIELVAPRPNAVESEGLRALIAERGEGLLALAFATHDAGAESSALREKGVRAAPAAYGEARGEDGGVRSYRTVELSPRLTRGLSVLAVERADTASLRGAPVSDPALVSALDMVTLRSSDPDAAIALYQGGLGIRLALDRPLFGTRMLFFRVGGVTVEVVTDPAAGERDAFFGLGYRVRDLQRAHARLGEAGFALSELRAGRKPGTRVFTVRDGTCRVRTLFIEDPARA